MTDLDVEIVAADHPHAALGEAGDDEGLGAARATRDGGLERAGRDVDVAADDGGHDVEPLGEHLLLDLEIVFRREFLHVGDRRVMREFQVAEAHQIARRGLREERGARGKQQGGRDNGRGNQTGDFQHGLGGGIEGTPVKQSPREVEA